LKKEIPVEFDYKGKHYKGVLIPVSGAANNTYYLTIDKHYCGQLMLVEDSPPDYLEIPLMSNTNGGSLHRRENLKS
jgi:hypothetical protein